MANIQKTLDSLQPYVIGIRYQDGVPLVDALFKEGWVIPDDSSIKKLKGNEEVNYFMIYSDQPSIGVDELLGYVEMVIKLNQEREKKHELLRVRVNELKEIFKKNSLKTLTRLKFTISEEELLPELDEFDLDSLDSTPEIMAEPTTQELPYVEEINTQTPQTYLDAEGNPIELTDEEKEILEEEARGERNRQLLTQKHNKVIKNNTLKNIELPPKTKTKTVTSNGTCDCGSDEACAICIDNK